MQRESLDLQKGAIAQQRVAVEQQTRHLRLYRRVLAVSAVVAALAAWVDCSALGLPNPSRQFLDVGRVAFSPGANFARSHRQWVRVNLACSPDLVVEGVRRMAASV